VRCIRWRAWCLATPNQSGSKVHQSQSKALCKGLIINELTAAAAALKSLQNHLACEPLERFLINIHKIIPPNKIELRHIFFPIFLLLFTWSYGQDGKLVKTKLEVRLEGKIANKFPVEMKLVATNSSNERLYCYADKQESSFKVSGYYIYTSKNKEIPIIGDIQTREDGTMDVIFYELDSIYSKRAIFKGKSNTNDLKTIHGTWQNIQKGNPLSFSLCIISNTDFTFEEQIFLNNNLWDLKVIFGYEVVLADELSVIEKQENDKFVAYLLYLQFYSNPNVCGMCGSDPSDEKLVWIKIDKATKVIIKRQLFDLTVCRGSISNDFNGGFTESWTKILLNIIANEFDPKQKRITNISISKDKFWEGIIETKK
jgi:hypothetical protein